MTQRQGQPHPVVPQNNQRPKFPLACRRRESRSDAVVLRKDAYLEIVGSCALFGRARSNQREGSFRNGVCPRHTHEVLGGSTHELF